MKVAVIQPSYIPWLGYFYMLQWSDLFIFYDDVQFDKNGWRNRNRVIVNDKVKWLTLSLNKKALPKSLKDRRLDQVEIGSPLEFKRHKELLAQYYRKSSYIDTLDKYYVNSLDEDSNLVNPVIKQIEIISNHLGLKTKFHRSSKLDYILSEDQIDHPDHPNESRNARLLSLLKRVGATEYMSGLSARSYINETQFTTNHITLRWNPFSPNDPKMQLSIIHYLLAVGESSVLKYLSI